MSPDETMDRIALLVLRRQLIREDREYERRHPELTARFVAEVERRAIRLHMKGAA